MNNFYFYRLPGEGDKVTAASSRRILEFDGVSLQPGFVIYPFDRSSHPALLIPADSHEEIEIEFPDLAFFPENSTPRAEHADEVETIARLCREGSLTKAVAAKVIVGRGEIDIKRSFLNLCRLYPDAFLFCFGTEQTGVWLGASPETLLSCHEGNLSTMALAGTRPAGERGEWDRKNIEEHQVVVDFIRDEFEKAGLSPKIFPTGVRRAGPVEHLCTRFEALSRRADASQSQSGGISLAENLSPTPALCGLPRNAAMDIIKGLERFDRSSYAGFCGPVQSGDRFDFYVNLRSMLVDSDRFAIFVGGGINAMSVADSEWEETERKADTLRKGIIFYNDSSFTDATN